jgi:hypothetical protein
MFEPNPQLVAATWGTWALAAAVRLLSEQDLRWLGLLALFAVAGGLAAPAGLLWAVVLGILVIFEFRALWKVFIKKFRWKLIGVGTGALASVVLVWLVQGFPCRHELKIGLGSDRSAAESDCFRCTLPNEVNGGYGDTSGSWRGLFGTRALISFPIVALRQLGPFLPATVPAVIWFGLPRDLFTPTIAVAGFAGLTLFASAREELPFLALMPILGALAVWVWRQKTKEYVVLNRFADFLFVGMLLCPMLPILPRATRAWPLVVGQQSREWYLIEREPTWIVAEILRIWPSQQVKLLSEETRRAYLPCPVVLEEDFRKRTDYHRVATSWPALSELLMQEGITHLLLVEREKSSVEGFPTFLHRMIAEASSQPDSGLIPLVDYRFPKSEGGFDRYRLLLLKGKEEKRPGWD